MSKNISALSKRKGLERNLFEALTETAGAPGGVEATAWPALAEEFLVGESSVLGAASFYDFLKEENAGKKVYLCNGTACMLAGTQEDLARHLETRFKKDECGHMCCLGRCHENRAFQYNGINYSGRTDPEIDAILDAPDDQPAEGADTFHVGSSLDTPVLTGSFPGVDLFYGLLKDLLKQTPEALIETLKASGVRGRGGAGFPMGVKWEACRNAEGSPKFIVCNADEGDPGAYTDRYLLEQQPHLVLFGMMVAGYIVGADTGILYIRAEYPESVRRIREAVDEIQNTDYLGESICGTGFNFRFKIIQAAGAYICGEETALLASIEGQRPEVRIRPPFPAQEGLFRKPTVVNNVETLALVHPVFNLGVEAFTNIGTPRSSFTKLVSLDSRFNRPGVYELEMGMPLTRVFEEFGGGFKVPVKAVQIGGPLGGVVPREKFEALTLDFESFQEHGFLLGHAGVVGIPADFPMLTYMEHLFEFCAAESCGKCFPCRLGSTRGGELCRKAQEEEYRIDRSLIDDLLETLSETSLCELGGGVPLPIRNILQHFQEELTPYFTKGSSS